MKLNIPITYNCLKIQQIYKHVSYCWDEMVMVKLSMGEFLTING